MFPLEPPDEAGEMEMMIAGNSGYSGVYALETQATFFYGPLADHTGGKFLQLSSRERFLFGGRVGEVIDGRKKILLSCTPSTSNRCRGPACVIQHVQGSMFPKLIGLSEKSTPSEAIN
jgi:hypothetical protein